MTRKIIHVDMDAFFASVEQRDDPALRGRPVAVGGAGGRGVVAAASYEARVFGVRSAMPSVTASRRCPDLVFVRPRFDVYKAVSAQVRAIFERYTPIIEPLSLDEAYLDVTANPAGLPSATATAEAIRAAIRAETGLTASAGVSYNKLLAKLASDVNKPDGLCVIRPARGAAFARSLDIARFHGIGPATAEKMRRLGIHSGADLAGWPREELVQRFGKAGGWYWGIARGQDDRPVNPDRVRKSSGSETTFASDLTTADAVEAGVAAMADDVWDWAERSGQRARTVTVKVKFADFRLATRSRTRPTPLPDRTALHESARDLVRAFYPLRHGIRLLGVTLSGFEETHPDVPPQMAFEL